MSLRLSVEVPQPFLFLGRRPLPMFLDKGIARIEKVLYQDRSLATVFAEPRILQSDLLVEWNDTGFSLNLPEEGLIRLTSREPIFTQLFPAGFIELWGLATGKSGYIGDSRLDIGDVQKMGNFGQVEGT